ncbi:MULTISPECIES: ATP synthase F1 subunit gamma [Clostridium]|jgi:F-type H+-transporting ATPase subunit gamma|uniref:ATP synthase gamma chain n=1 Tax=Clostridium lapidicellarium TaxID=3240931 RepID=A0ABV4DWL8_9CLOT|nr:ATP synthase F1 subunit gamma [uncultured Clostridium sp.]NLU08926.1 F0F1 ATP synthase subunit gamma [Clostridiales bacterium]
MAGAGLVKIKRRIKSITSTQKITKAMGLIATSKLRKVRRKLEANNKYSELFGSIINELVLETEGNNIYIDGNNSDNKLYVALNSDTGLCGGFNMNVVNKTDSIMSKEKDKSILVAVGQKGRMYFKRLGYNTQAEYVDIPDVPTIKEASTIVYKALELYREGKVGEVNIVYTRFISTVRQNVVVEKLLPLESKKSEKRNFLIKFEPAASEMIGDMVVSHLKQKILNCMINSKVSEQASRMTAMDGATKNANELLSDLNLKYNRARQSAITQEITEIIGGAEALK